MHAAVFISVTVSFKLLIEMSIYSVGLIACQFTKFYLYFKTTLVYKLLPQEIRDIAGEFLTCFLIQEEM